MRWRERRESEQVEDRRDSPEAQEENDNLTKVRRRRKKKAKKRKPKYKPLLAEGFAFSRWRWWGWVVVILLLLLGGLSLGFCHISSGIGSGPVYFGDTGVNRRCLDQDIL
ncbi:MAG: hypothetical protein ACL7BU_04360 [Candidatus Phlomobacter fragariae]